MPSLPVLKVLLREVVTRQQTARVPEPDLVMNDSDKVAAFTRAGREDGVMAPVYLFHCAQVCDVVRPGDLVIDLGCGPATQLAMIARLLPETEFLGVDFSDEMLARARQYVADEGLLNVRFHKADMSRLSFLNDASVDAVYSTVALHHLPGAEEFHRTFAEVGRILRPGGGIYLVDFGRLRSRRSIDYFAYQYADRQPELFTLDYLYSLNAAFTLEEFRTATRRYLGDRAKVFATFLAPFLVAVKSRPRTASSEVSHRLDEIRRRLPRYHQTDVKDLTSWFALGGLRSRHLH
jgi:ubiquinone/menaquinone biosynthesis C-methylase UbiE